MTKYIPGTIVQFPNHTQTPPTPTAHGTNPNTTPSSNNHSTGPNLGHVVMLAQPRQVGVELLDPLLVRLEQLGPDAPGLGQLF